MNDTGRQGLLMDKMRRRDVIRLVGSAAIVGTGTAMFGAQALAETEADDDDQRGPDNDANFLPALSAFGVVGTVLSSGPDQIQVRSKTEVVRAAPALGARMYSGVSGVVTSPSQFVVGDRVFVDGARRTGDIIEATRIGSLYEVVRFKVLSVDTVRGVALTSIGPLDLTGSLPDIGRVQHSLKAHQKLGGLLWTHPQTGQKFLMLAQHDRLA